MNLEVLGVVLGVVNAFHLTTRRAKTSNAPRGGALRSRGMYVRPPRRGEASFSPLCYSSGDPSSVSSFVGAIVKDASSFIFFAISLVIWLAIVLFSRRKRRAES